MRASSYSLACLVFGITSVYGGRHNHGIKQNDFVKVKGLRLYDSEGLHYITGTERSTQLKQEPDS